MLAFFCLYKNQDMNLSSLPPIQDEICINFHSHPEAGREEKEFFHNVEAENESYRMQEPPQ